MGGVLKLLIFSYSQNPTGYEYERDYCFGGGRKSKQLLLCLRRGSRAAL